MNDVAKLLSVIIFLSGFVYLAMMLLALPHAKSGDKKENGNPVSPFWSFYQKIYDDSGQALCRYGRKLFIFMWIATFIWLMIK